MMFVFYKKTLLMSFVFSFVVYTVRGMMYYRKALELQAFLDMAKDDGKLMQCPNQPFFKENCLEPSNIT